MIVPVLARFRNWRRERILSQYAIPDGLWRDATRRLALLRRLDEGEEQRLRELAVLFLHEKRIEPAGGMQLDELMRVRLAALATEPVLALGIECLRGFRSVVVYPTEFVARDREEVDEDGVVHVGDDVLCGEAWDGGPVVLAWEEVEASGVGRGYNVVAHEVAHKLDLLDGAANGLPPLHAGMRRADWTAAFLRAYEDLKARLERGEDPWLDPYAAEDPGEFFAVCTEVFFDVPKRFAKKYPDLYAQLAAFFKQDPARAQPGRRAH
jgi:Mlc titration factor MtfA (ptsG expression regulator)